MMAMVEGFEVVRHYSYERRLGEPGLTISKWDRPGFVI